MDNGKMMMVLFIGGLLKTILVADLTETERTQLGQEELKKTHLGADIRIFGLLVTQRTML
jgi:hypothetical protein